MVIIYCYILLNIFLSSKIEGAWVLETEFPLNQMKKLAQYVCEEHDFNQEDASSSVSCPDNFLNTDRSVHQESEVRVRCRWSKRTLKLEVTPSTSWQVAILKPDDDGDIVYYSLVWPNTTYVDLQMYSETENFTLFSSVLSKGGRPSLWRQHEKVLAWDLFKSNIPEKKDYGIHVDPIYNRENDDITVVVSWNHTGDADTCFSFYNFCSGVITPEKVWPDMNQSMVLTKLPFDTDCQLSVTGLYGETVLEYHTPQRDANNSEVEDFQNSRIVELSAEQSGAGWEVLVRWTRAGGARPDRYTALLRASKVYTLNLTGDATEAIFTDVMGEGLYNISLFAFKGEHQSHAFEENIFPAITKWRWGAAGAAWVGVALCLLGVTVYCLKLRIRRDMDLKPMDQESRPLDDTLVTLETECEDQWEIKCERLVFHEVIGEGAFGKVRRAVLAPTGKEVAVKMLKDYPTAEEVRAFRLEMEVMKSVGAHGHVVSLLGCCSGKRPFIVQEYCSRGDLLSFLRCSWDVMVSKLSAKYYNNNIETDYRNDLFKCKPQRSHSRLVINKMYDLPGLCEADLTSRDLLSFCRQIAMGMEFLAANRLVHRDLAARNVLVTSDRTLKIADFGLSRDVYEENEYRQKGNVKMPVKWMAPESLSRRIFTSQSDVWSFGVVVWEVVSVGGAPYAGVPPARLPRLLHAGYRMPRPVNCSKQLYDVMLSCWAAHPRARPSFPALHARLDDLLNCACADDYLSLQLDEPPPPHPALSYFKMIMRGKRAWARETYERPLKALTQGKHNHYSSPPVTLAKAPA